MSDEPGALADVAPTILDIMGLPQPEGKPAASMHTNDSQRCLGDHLFLRNRQFKYSSTASSKIGCNTFLCFHTFPRHERAVRASAASPAGVYTTAHSHRADRPPSTSPRPSRFSPAQPSASPTADLPGVTGQHRICTPRVCRGSFDGPESGRSIRCKGLKGKRSVQTWRQNIRTMGVSTPGDVALIPVPSAWGCLVPACTSF